MTTPQSPVVASPPDPWASGPRATVGASGGSASPRFAGLTGFTARFRVAGEPTPWAVGVPVSLFFAVVVGLAIYVLTDGLWDHPVVAVAINVVVAAGLAPGVWLSRSVQVLRWVGAGTALGVLVGWVAAIAALA